MSLSYKLRATLDAHSADVRAISCDGADIITASRDKTAILWRPSDDNPNVYVPVISYESHKGYVTSVVMVPASPEYPDGLTITGCQDSKIRAFTRNSATPVKILSGHSETVSSLAWRDNVLVSGSWDKSAKVWSNWECKHDMVGHTGPIWAVGIVPSQDSGCVVLTASADKLVKSWNNSKEITTYAGHTDCVRGLTIKNASNFYSCSNDATVIHWSIEGDKLAVFYGHTMFIYTVAYISSNDHIVTGGEDRTFRIWNSSGDNIQTQHMPAQSAWAVCALANGDIVVGSSDYKARIFSVEAERQCDDETLATFDESVAGLKVPMADVAGINKSDLPDKRFLYSPGKKDGQTAMINEDNKIMCYSWSENDQKWSKVGEVVGGTGGSAESSGKVLYQGKEYDFVFDVDIDTGAILKLPYNKCEDPWHVAQQFIHKNDLPQTFLDQVANFIITNAGVSGAGNSMGQGYQDPFTGGARYVPGSSSSQSHDPFTGANAYKPSFSSKYFPQVTTIRFDNSNKAGMLTKLKQSNESVADKLEDTELTQMVEHVCSSVTDPTVLAPLEKALQWPLEFVWPALDVLRLALRFEVVQNTWISGEKGQMLINLLIGFLKPPYDATVQLLTLRCLANVSCHKHGQELLMQHRNTILASTTELCPFPNKNMEIAAATIVMNFSALVHNSANVEDKCQVLSAAATLTLSTKDLEALFRIMVAFGTVLHQGGDVKTLAQSLDMKSIIETISSTKDLEKLNVCTKDVLRLL